MKELQGSLSILKNVNILAYLMKGVAFTLIISAVAVIIGILFGYILAIVRNYCTHGKYAILGKLAAIYIEVFRNTPLLLWIFICLVFVSTPKIFQIPMLGLSSVETGLLFKGIVALTFFESSNIAEIVRGGLNAIPKGQFEAAYSQGFSAPSVMIHIILPQVYHKIVPTLARPGDHDHQGFVLHRQHRRHRAYGKDQAGFVRGMAVQWAEPGECIRCLRSLRICLSCLLCHRFCLVDGREADAEEDRIRDRRSWPFPEEEPTGIRPGFGGGKMAEHYVITISRQFGSLGRPIAQKTAQMLGIYFMDRDIVEETSKRMGLLASEIGDREEQARRNAYYYMKFPLGIAPQSIEDEIFAVQSSIIRDCAAKQDCIIVGRCAEYVLREKKRRVSFYIRAPYEARLNNCVETLHLRSSEAERMIRDVDLARARYRRRYVKNLDGMSEYTDCDIVLDSSRFGVEKTAELIVSAAKTVLDI